MNLDQCSECHKSIATECVVDSGVRRRLCPGCITLLLAGAKKRGGWGLAQKTTVGDIKFPSKLEARVYLRLVAEVARIPGARIYRQVRFPLFSLAAGQRLLPLYLSVDFVIRDRDGSLRLIDAKPKRWKSRDWRRGKAALEAQLETKIEEIHG